MNLEIIHISKMLAKLHWKSYKYASRWSVAYVCELMIMVIYVCFKFCMLGGNILFYESEQWFIK